MPCLQTMASVGTRASALAFDKMVVAAGSPTCWATTRYVLSSKVVASEGETQRTAKVDAWYMSAPKALGLVYGIRMPTAHALVI